MKSNPSLLLFLALILFPHTGRAAPDDVLVSFRGGETQLEMPAETFPIAQSSKGRVTQNDDIHLSGYSAIQIRELAEDGDFAELRASFSERNSGTLLIHFHLLIANPYQEMNAILAGNQFFNLEKDGASLWLKLMKGSLWSWYEVTPRKLFKPEPFTWYQFDAIYDAAKGVTLLRVLESLDGREVFPPTELRNASGLAGSKIRLLSFTGDLRDEDTATFFVDDLQIRAGDFDKLPDYVTPEPRKFFLDSWKELRDFLQKKVRCIPPRKLSDLGIAPLETAQLRGETLSRIENALLRDEPDAEFERGLPKAITDWKHGCEKLKEKDGNGALDIFRFVRENNPEVTSFQLSLSLAYAVAGNIELAEQSLVAFSPGWLQDVRFAATLAAITEMSGKILERDSLLSPTPSSLNSPEEKFAFAELLQTEREAGTISRIVEQHPTVWERFRKEVLNREEYFYTLLWKEKYEEARAFADKLSETQSYRKSDWLEMAGDASLFLLDFKEAESRYHAAIAVAKKSADARIYGKLADIAWSTKNFKEAMKLRRKAFRYQEF